MSREINCSAFETYLNQLLDKRRDLRTDDVINRHANSCAKCKTILDDYLALDDSFSNVVFDVATIAKLEKPAVKPSFQSTWMSLAIAVVFIVGLGTALNRPVQDSPIQIASALPTVTAVSPAEAKTESPLKEPSVSIASDANVSNASEIPDHGSLVGIKTPRTNDVSWDSISEQFGPLNTYYQISAELPGVRPIHSSVNVTLDWIQNALAGW